MDKFAQDKKKRDIGFFNEKKEDIGVGFGKILEQFTGEESEFSKIMNSLRDVDNNVRETAVSLKNIIKAARTSFNRREYIATISYLGQFHDAFTNIMNEFNKLSSVVDLKHNEFLFKDVDQDALKYFREKFPDKFKKKAFIKNAGFKDWWHNLTNDKGRALKAWEKRFPKSVKKFKNDTDILLTKAETLQNNLTLSLKEMASLRASREIEEYLNSVAALTAKYKDFDSYFNKYYQEHAKKYIEQDALFSKEKEEAKAIEEANNTRQIGIPPSTLIDPVATPVIVPAQIGLPTESPVSAAAPAVISEPVTNMKEPVDLIDMTPDYFEKLKREEEARVRLYKAKEGIQENLDNLNKQISDEQIKAEEYKNKNDKDGWKTSLEKIYELRKLLKSMNEKLNKEENDLSKYNNVNNFLQNLTKLSNENPIVLANEIIKFASTMEDKVASKKLLSLARNILK